MDQAGIGFLILVVAGVMNASFTLPMKFTRNWNWENTWLVYSFLAYFLFPWLSAIVSIPRLFEVYREAGLTAVLLASLFGLG